MVALSTAKGWMMAGKERLMETYQTSFSPFGGFDKNLSDAGSYWRVLFALISKAWSVPKIISLWPVIHGQVILSDVFACERRSPSGARFIFLSTHSCCCSFCLWSIGGIPELGSSADHPVRYLGAGWIFVRFIIVTILAAKLNSTVRYSSD